MKAYLAIPLLLLAICYNTKAECPQLREIPTMYGDTNTFTCARYYIGPGGNYPVNGCNGCSSGTYFDVVDGQDATATEGHLYGMGSIMVKPGCTLAVYREYNYQGDYSLFNTGIHTLTGEEATAGDCGYGYRSYKCRCGLTPVNCAPRDQFESVLRCDALSAVSPVKCDYIKKVGVKYSDELSQTISVGLDVEYEISAGLFEIFEASLGESVSTGFDWTSTSTSTKSQVEEFKVLASAPPGLLLTIEQAVGTCGGSIVNTELFRIRHTDSKGNIVHEEFETL